MKSRGPQVAYPGSVALRRQGRRRLRSASWLGTVSTVVLVGIFALFIVGPLVWIILRAFADRWEYPALLPEAWTLRWWSSVLSDPALLDSIKLSFTFAPIVTLISAAICLPAAYGFARFEFPGRRTFLISLFATNAFPRTGLFVAMASFFYELNLMGSFTGVVIVQLIGTVVFMTWIPAAAFASIPRSLEEAARDAGASALRTFWTITFPLAAPGILVAVIVSFLAAFDESQGTFLVGVPNYTTMPMQMYAAVVHLPQQGAAVFALLLTVPSVVMLLMTRKHLMSGHLAEGFQIR
jgi:putative spermidine/putrescine transport system permease protein